MRAPRTRWKPRRLAAVASKNMSRVLSRYLRDLIVNSFIASPIVPVPARWRVLRRLGAEVERSFVAPRVSLGSISGLTIGKGTYINYGVTIDGPGEVIIGSSCGIAAKVMIITSTHEIGAASKRAGDLKSFVTTIGDGAWIGAGAIILPGVTIGPGCVIGAGAVVTGDCEPNSVYAGVPARFVRSLA